MNDRPPSRGSGGPRRSVTRGVGAAVIGMAVAAAVVPVSPVLVERAYSVRVYPALQRVLTGTSNLVPFAVFDALIVATIVAWVIAGVRDARRVRWLPTLGRVLFRTAVLGAALYLAFLIAWGLNYRRVPLTDKVQFDPAAITAGAARLLASTTVDRLNALHGRAHEAGWAPFGAVDPGLTAGFVRAQRDLGGRGDTVAGRPKATLLNPYFRRAGVAGMTDPYFLETLVQRELLPFERSFVVAHEWSHLAGFVDESEANFVGWLTCLRGSVADQYSGWLFLYAELAAAIRGSDRADIAARLAAGPRADLRAIADRLRRQVNPAVATAGWRVYDSYLKANRVEAGAASYAEVVRLVLGVRFGPDWTVRLKADSSH